MSFRETSERNIRRQVRIGVSLCILTWGYYLVLVALLYSPTGWNVSIGTFLLAIIPPLLLGMYCNSLVNKSEVAGATIHMASVVITLIPALVVEVLRIFQSDLWIGLVPISLSFYGGALLALSIRMIRRRLYIDELLAWISHAWRNRHQLRAGIGHDKELEERGPTLPLNIPDTPISPQLASVLQVVRDDVSAARAHFHTWWTLRTLGKPEYRDVMNDERYAYFFDVTISGHYKLIFASLARVFDRYSSVAGVTKLAHLLVESERRDLAQMLFNVMEEKDDLIHNIFKIGNLTVLHSELWPRDKPIHTKPPITAEEIRELIDAVCDAINEITIALGHKRQIPSGFRHEEAVLELLELLRSVRVEYEISEV